MKDKDLADLEKIIEEISSSDVEYLIWVRDFIIKNAGWNMSFSLEKIINILERVDNLKNKN